ncbi:uncharacterized protein LOC106676402 [Maylandia zebra]|uniref:uncharacterized protein LOC106676402 n=1 Tax=Maylandia zebra TaxID=106582 RepID=UPI00403CE1D0
MTAPTKLLIILGENNALKLTLPLGIPKNVNELKAEIENQCGVSEQFRLQYMDTDFNQFLNMTSTFDLKDMDKIKVIKTGVPETSTGSNESSVSSFNLGSPCSGHNPDYDTDILSSPESRSSSSSSSANSTLRSEAWPLDFRIPEFSFDVELQLTKGNQEFQANGTLLTLKPKLKSDILESLSSEIMKYKAYPSDSNLSDVCQALVVKHPCLKEKGSETGFSAWKISLKYKMSNYRGKLKNLGCSELVINSLKRRGNSNVHPNQVKKPRRAEVNFCPDYPAGETRESQEEERLVLLSEFKKKNNNETIKAKMAQTFPHRRQEILQDTPFVADFKSRWPALFSPREINAEFQRITTIPLTSTFMAQLDNNTTKLTKVFRNKGGTSGRKITEIMAAIDERHWLLVNFKVHFKILVLVLRALHGQAPSYNGDLLSPNTPSRSLRSSDQSLVVHNSLKTKSDRSLLLWPPNSGTLLLSLRSVDSNDTVAMRRVCTLKGLAVYLNEDPNSLIKEYQMMDQHLSSRSELSTVLQLKGIFHPKVKIGLLPYYPE